MTDLELRHLAAMAAIADEGSFGRAAARLGYTQSTVSQQIAALERAVGGAVFDRPGGPKPVRITPLGSVVLAHGRDVLAKAEALSGAVDRFKAGGGRIDIGTFQSVSTVILPSVVRRLRDEHPDCDIRLFEEESAPADRSASSTCCSTTDRFAEMSSMSSCSTTRTCWSPRRELPRWAGAAASARRPADGGVAAAG